MIISSSVKLGVRTGFPAFAELQRVKVFSTNGQSLRTCLQVGCPCCAMAVKQNKVSFIYFSINRYAIPWLYIISRVLLQRVPGRLMWIWILLTHVKRRLLLAQSRLGGSTHCRLVLIGFYIRFWIDITGWRYRDLYDIAEVDHWSSTTELVSLGRSLSKM